MKELLGSRSRFAVGTESIVEVVIMALSYDKIRENVKRSGWICEMPSNTCVGFCDRAFVKGCPLSGTKMTEKDCEELIAKMKHYRNES